MYYKLISLYQLYLLSMYLKTNAVSLSFSFLDYSVITLTIKKDNYRAYL